MAMAPMPVALVELPSAMAPNFVAREALPKAMARSANALD